MRIVKASIDPLPISIFDPDAKVAVVYDDGTEEILFELRPEDDPISEADLIGKTKEEAKQMKG